MTRESAPAHENATWPVEHAKSDGPKCIAVPLLLPGTVLTLQTDDSRYRLVVLDGDRGRVLVSGGTCFPRDTEVLLGGAGEDGGKAGWIIEGLRLQMWSADRRVVLSAIRTIGIDG